MKLRSKFALYNAITKIAVILVLGIIILFSLDKIAYNQLDNRLNKKKSKILNHINDKEINSLLNSQQSFTDYNILKEEFIILTKIKKEDTDSISKITTEKREIEGDVEVYRILNHEFIYDNNWYKLELGESMTALQSIKNVIRFYMLIVLFVSIIITLLADFTFSSYLLKPFYLIIDKKINKVNDLSEYNYQNISTSTDDFKILDESLNSLIRKINNLFLIEKQFIANVSHELLTPISILSTRFENMLNTDGIPEEHQNKIFASLKTINRLKLIINSLLLISKVENNQYLKTEEIDINTELQEISEDIEDRITDKNISYKLELKHNYQIKGNKALIHTLLTNIINNAIKYNREAGNIAITDQLNKETYVLIITDNGIGMKKELVNNVFERFERGNNDEKGYGLGLAIAQSIANFHKIDIQIESEENVGTKVKLVFNKEV
jgi:signal transduction histidine kinase